MAIVGIGRVTGCRQVVSLSTVSKVGSLFLRAADVGGLRCQCVT